MVSCFSEEEPLKILPHVRVERGETQRREEATSQVKVWLARTEINFPGSLFHQNGSIRGRRKCQTYYSPVTPGAADMTNYQQMEGHISKPDKILIPQEESKNSRRQPIIFRLMWQWVTATLSSHINSSHLKKEFLLLHLEKKLLAFFFLLLLLSKFFWFFFCAQRHQGSSLSTQACL